MIHKRQSNRSLLSLWYKEQASLSHPIIPVCHFLRVSFPQRNGNGITLLTVFVRSAPVGIKKSNTVFSRVYPWSEWFVMLWRWGRLPPPLAWNILPKRCIKQLIEVQPFLSKMKPSGKLVVVVTAVWDIIPFLLSFTCVTFLNPKSSIAFLPVNSTQTLSSSNAIEIWSVLPTIEICSQQVVDYLLHSPQRHWL